MEYSAIEVVTEETSELLDQQCDGQGESSHNVQFS